MRVIYIIRSNLTNSSLCVCFPLPVTLSHAYSCTRYPTRGYQRLQLQAKSETVSGLVEGHFCTEMFYFKCILHPQSHEIIVVHGKQHGA